MVGGKNAMLRSVQEFGREALDTFLVLWVDAIAFLPKLAVSLIILIAGYLFARLAAMIVRRLLEAVGFNRLCEKMGVVQLLTRINVEKDPSYILGRVVFWVLLLASLLLTSDYLGFERLSAAIQSFVQYLPRILVALVIVSIGLFVASFVRDAIRAGIGGLSPVHANVLGQTAYVSIGVIAAALAVDQLELETQLLTIALGIAITAAGIAAALALGLGSRDVTGNVLAGFYLRNTYPVGTRIQTEEFEGEIKSIDAISTVLEVNQDIEKVVPNKTLLNATVSVEVPPREPDEDSLDEHP